MGNLKAERKCKKYLHDQPIVPRSDEEKKAVINRLRRIERQVRGIQRMVEEGRYCVDVLVQISAIQAALKKVGLSVTERHVNHCVRHAITEGEGEEAVGELLEVLTHFTK